MKFLVEQYYLGNYSMVLEHAAEDIQWVSHKMANVQLKNKKEVAAFLENAPKGRFSFEISRFIMDEQNVVAEGICRYTNQEGKLIENFFCDIFTFENNRIVKVSSYFV
jgi:ketosteroid isomerase-like protein